MNKYLQEIEKCVKSHENTLKVEHSLVGCRREDLVYTIGFVDVYVTKSDNTTDMLLKALKECPNENYKVELAFNGERYIFVVREKGKDFRNK